MAYNSRRRTKRVSGNFGAITCTATHGASSASPVTEAEPAIPLGAALRWQRARITQILARTEGVRSYFLSLPQPLSHHAGQHVDVRLTAPDGYQARRSYSIASAPESSGAIELVVERLDNGEVSPFFHDVAVVGDVIELRGPIGGDLGRKSV